MKREFLTGELGLSKEITEKIMAAYGASVHALRSENEKMQSENQKLIESFSAHQENVQDIEEMKTQLTALLGEKEQLMHDKESLETALFETKRDSQITAALSAAGAKNVKAAGALLDKTVIFEDEDGMHGVEEQIAKIKQDCGYLFYDGFTATGMRHAPTPKADDGFTRFARAGAKLQ